jgi:hypothetical protein
VQAMRSIEGLLNPSAAATESAVELRGHRPGHGLGD